MAQSQLIAESQPEQPPEQKKANLQPAVHEYEEVKPPQSDLKSSLMALSLSLFDKNEGERVDQN